VIPDFMAVHDQSSRPQCGATFGPTRNSEGWIATGCTATAMSGARLKLAATRERRHLKVPCLFPAVLGKTGRTDDRGDRGKRRPSFEARP